jgi:hypothetical protein
MSKRKYEKDVSELVYGEEYSDGTIAKWSETRRTSFQNIPVRIIREKFYRQLIKIYEEWKES